MPALAQGHGEMPQKAAGRRPELIQMLGSAFPICGAWDGSRVRNNCFWLWGFFPQSASEVWVLFTKRNRNLQGWGEAEGTSQGAKQRQKWVQLRPFFGSEGCCEPGELTGRLLGAEGALHIWGKQLPSTQATTGLGFGQSLHQRFSPSAPSVMA